MERQEILSWGSSIERWLRSQALMSGHWVWNQTQLNELRERACRRTLCGMMEMFYILIGVVVLRMYKFFKKLIKLVHFIACNYTSIKLFTMPFLWMGHLLQLRRMRNTEFLWNCKWNNKTKNGIKRQRLSVWIWKKNKTK